MKYDWMSLKFIIIASASPNIGIDINVQELMQQH